MKSLPFACAMISLTLSLPCSADRILLKDGTSLEGKVLRETPDAYTIEIQVTKSIKDERVIARSDVSRIEREEPDAIAFKEIESLNTIPDLLNEQEYTSRIAAVEKFLKEHPKSLKSGEAKAILLKLKTEANEVLAGGIKMNGKIVPASERRMNAYEVDARAEDIRIRAMIKEGNYLGALRAFITFSNDFRNTKPHAELVPVITQVIQSYMAGVNQNLATFEARVKERELGLQRMASGERNNTQNAIREETADHEDRLKQEKDAKIGWVTVSPFLKATLDESITFGKQELARLEAYKNAPFVDGGKAYREAFSLIQGNGDSAAVTSAIAAAKNAMVAPRYIETLEAAAKSGGSAP